jgi:hypothetical protein
MATLTSAGITFGDATTQATAAVGIRGQVFTASGTFTIPTGTTAIKVTIVGGGASSTGNNCGVFVSANSGATSSVASGTQSITTISATGGGTASQNNAAQGGIGSGGDINIRGGTGNGNEGSGASPFAPTAGTFSAANSYGSSGGGPNTAQGGGGMAIKYLTGLTPGGTLTVTRGAGGSAPTGGYAGGGGIIVFEY